MHYILRAVEELLDNYAGEGLLIIDDSMSIRRDGDTLLAFFNDNYRRVSNERQAAEWLWTVLAMA